MKLMLKPNRLLSQVRNKTCSNSNNSSMKTNTMTGSSHLSSTQGRLATLLLDKELHASEFRMMSSF